MMPPQTFVDIRICTVQMCESVIIFLKGINEMSPIHNCECETV